MKEQVIQCPSCGSQIPLTEAITRKIEEELRGEYAAAAKKKEAEIIRLANEKAREDSGVELTALKDDNAAMAQRLKKSQDSELELRRKMREVNERENNLDLEVARRVDTDSSKIRDEALKRARDEHSLKDRENEKKISDLIAQLDEAKRKAEQGSQQAQGEVLELQLEDVLKATFPADAVEPVPKGTKGADVLQRVHDVTGRYCGTIIWESKRTKNWSDGWIDKLKEDQREAKADIAVLMSIVLPKEVNGFFFGHGIWISNCASAMGLAAALRITLIQVAHERQASVGKQEKMEVLYGYLSGPEFRQRVEAIVEAFSVMNQDLDDEKRVITKQWAKREKQIARVIANTAKMYGDMQGIIGASLPEIKKLELKALTDESNVETEADSI